MSGPPGSRGRITLADVAEAARVSKSIASRVLNGDPAVNVREATRARVLESAAQLNYRPHSFARALRMSSSGVMAFLVPDLTNPIISRVLRGAVDRAREVEATVLVFEDKDPTESAAMVAELHRAGRIDGIVVASAIPGHPLIDELLSSGVPHVFVNRGVPGSRRNVTMDDAAGARLAVEHLQSLGHTRLAHIAGPSHVENSNRRASGFADAARLSSGGSGAIVHVPFDYSAGDSATRDLLSSAAPPTGIFTSSLQQAIGVLHAAYDLGVAVPLDLSIIATDDLPLADYLVPELTTVGLPTAELGSVAVDALSEQMRGVPPSDVVLTTRPRLRQRGSTGPPPAE